MRDKVPDTSRPSISDAERARRRAAMANALAGNRLEGLVPSPEVIAISELWVDGQIENDERKRRMAAFLARQING